jgi:UDP-N-acetylmuramyl tripeptide synthase
MFVMKLFATFIGKGVLLLLKALGRKGSALPGLIVEKLYPSYLNKMLGQLPQGVILVVGTNGKTTTTKVISELLHAQDLRVLSNPTGSNFVRGIVATILRHATFGGKLPYDIAVLEQDEAWAVHFVEQVQPVGVVVLNVMRDQMDRFGEIDATAQMLGKAVGRAHSWVVLNANDPRVAKLAEAVQGPNITWFGHAEALLPQFLSDDQHHSQETAKFFEGAPPQVRLTEFGQGHISFTLNGQAKTFPSLLDGSHNAINMMAAIAAAHATLPQLNIDSMLQTAATITPAFGRGERITLPGGGELRLQLVKNPAGFTHSLRLLDDAAYQAIGLAINDDYPDGRDVSWLWDVDYRPLAGHKAQMFCGGVRAYDMAVRLKYDEITCTDISTDLIQFLQRVLDGSAALSASPGRSTGLPAVEPVALADPSDSESAAELRHQAIIFCTYTAMLNIRKLLKKQYNLSVQEGL